MRKGERHIGAAKGKQTNTMASCQLHPPLVPARRMPLLEQHKVLFPQLFGTMEFGRSISCLSPKITFPRDLGLDIVFEDADWCPATCCQIPPPLLV